ncbi:MAG: hypothetical protein ABWZ66_00710 [Pyrinomonadaceae bacterium]
MRNHKNYFGRLVNFTDGFEVEVKGAFFILDSFSYNPTQKILNFTFNGWASADAFNREISPIPSGRHEYNLSDADFTAFKEANSAALLSIQDTLREFGNLGGGNWRFDSLMVNPTETVLIVSFSKGNSSRIIREEKDAYDGLITENAEIVQSIVEIAWTTALSTDNFFVNATLVS